MRAVVRELRRARQTEQTPRSIDRIAAATGLSEARVESAIRELRIAGLIAPGDLAPPSRVLH